MLRKMVEPYLVIDRVLRCHKFLLANGLPNNTHDICAYTHEKIGNDGAVLIYNNSLIGVATYSRYKFLNGIKRRLTYGSVFAYIEVLQDFIKTVVTDYSS